MVTIEPRNHLVRSTKKKEKGTFLFLCFRLFVSLDKILPLNKEKKEKGTFLFFYVFAYSYLCRKV